MQVFRLSIRLRQVRHVRFESSRPDTRKARSGGPFSFGAALRHTSCPRCLSVHVAEALLARDRPARCTVLEACAADDDRIDACAGPV
jgi:hypothetical protein